MRLIALVTCVALACSRDARNEPPRKINPAPTPSSQPAPAAATAPVAQEWSPAEPPTDFPRVAEFRSVVLRETDSAFVGRADGFMVDAHQSAIVADALARRVLAFGATGVSSASMPRAGAAPAS